MRGRLGHERPFPGATANVGMLLVPSVRNLERHDVAQDAVPTEATA